ncbi:FAD-binding oxidoreductase [Nocardia sp. CDC159]|uniref:FAD-binding oxidoreductase n=1 Tax=Nocardia pulmonis TaxID=2951408 RepID=A0A9X2EE12_9NOCA|nr:MULTISPECIES: FAD-binding oxidoreductase [Nocardia]MCM6777303.1 FAD-binding oxidoreductase [Nocardia pulmonis]MCM6790188.1 FAD-binding oxidoreductase [Nocardia sp. CDC159]
MTLDPGATGEIRLDAQEWTSTVVGHHRLRHDIAVIRLIGEFVPFVAGQSVEVQVPQHPGLRRRLSPALPPSLDGKLEFHVRTVPGGWCSGSIVADTRPGDEWRISDPGGWLSVDDWATDVVMIAGGTGLAPLRALLLELARRPEPPRTHLFVGGRSPRDLYASDMLYLLAGDMPWLTVVPVVEYADDPNWVDEWYENSRVDIGFDVDEMLEGTLPEVIGDMGPLLHHQVLVCGSPGMTRATVDRLIQTGTPAEAIRYEGL